jgi:hypothetical protein
MKNYDPSSKKEARKRIAWQIAVEQAVSKNKDALEIYETIMKDFENKDKENTVLSCVLQDSKILTIS